jgi:hypothetical protein
MTVMEKISAALNTNLGRCPRCIRQSFVVMLGTWGMVLVMTLATASSPALILSKVIAVGSTGLWLAHLAAFAIRATRSPTTARDEVLGRNVVTDPSPQPRRHFILAFSKSFLLAASAAALPIGAALAQSKMQQCLTCCATRLDACGNNGKCNTLYQNCVSSCNSQGASPSDWKCW